MKFSMTGWALSDALKIADARADASGIRRIIIWFPRVDCREFSRIDFIKFVHQANARTA
jgi:hypothetical protein